MSSHYRSDKKTIKGQTPTDDYDDGRLSEPTYLGVPFVVVLLSSDPARHQVVLDGVCQGKVVVTRGGHIAILDQGVMEMAVETLLDLVHILQHRNAPHTDLFALLLVRLWLRHLGHLQYLHSLKESNKVSHQERPTVQ